MPDQHKGRAGLRTVKCRIGRIEDSRKNVAEEIDGSRLGKTG